MMVGFGLAEVGVVRRKRMRGKMGMVVVFIVGEDEGCIPPGRVVVFVGSTVVTGQRWISKRY